MRALAFPLAIFVVLAAAGAASPSSIAVCGDPDDDVPLKPNGGTFVIPVTINGAITLDFVIDSGASDVQIPVDVFSTLVRANTIVSGDLIGKRKYVLADGSTQDEPRFVVRELKVGNHILRNVTASVGPAAGDLLLGQAFLSQFDSWTLDNKRHVLKLVEKSGQGADRDAPAADAGQAAAAAPIAPNGPKRFLQDALICGRQVEYKIDPTGANAGFLGVWTGNWSNSSRLCGGLVVESVVGNGTAEIIYVYGPSQPGTKPAWKQQHRMGLLDGGKLSFQDDEGSTFIFYHAGLDMLGATFISGSSRLRGSFQRYR